MAVSQADMDIYLTKMLKVKVQECTDLPILLCKILFIGINIELPVSFLPLQLQRKLYIGKHLVQLIHKLYIRRKILN